MVYTQSSVDGHLQPPVPWDAVTDLVRSLYFKCRQGTNHSNPFLQLQQGECRGLGSGVNSRLDWTMKQELVSRAKKRKNEETGRGRGWKDIKIETKICNIYKTKSHFFGKIKRSKCFAKLIPKRDWGGGEKEGWGESSAGDVPHTHKNLNSVLMLKSQAWKTLVIPVPDGDRRISNPQWSASQSESVSSRPAWDPVLKNNDSPWGTVFEAVL